MIEKLPKQASYIAQLSPGVRLYDVSHCLPQKRPPRQRRLTDIETVGVHHSGALNRPGYAGLLASTRYVTRVRGFRSCAYHYWVPYEDCVDADFHHIVFQALKPTDVGSHIRGLNRRSVGVCLQGNLRTRPMSFHQRTCLPPLLTHVRSEFNIKNEIMHCEAGELGGHGKKTCPGKQARAFIENIRA